MPKKTKSKLNINTVTVRVHTIEMPGVTHISKVSKEEARKLGVAEYILKRWAHYQRELPSGHVVTRAGAKLLNAHAATDKERTRKQGKIDKLVTLHRTEQHIPAFSWALFLIEDGTRLTGKHSLEAAFTCVHEATVMNLGLVGFHDPLAIMLLEGGNVTAMSLRDSIARTLPKLNSKGASALAKIPDASWSAAMSAATTVFNAYRRHSVDANLMDILEFVAFHGEALAVLGTCYAPVKGWERPHIPGRRKGENSVKKPFDHAKMLGAEFRWYYHMHAQGRVKEFIRALHIKLGKIKETKVKTQDERYLILPKLVDYAAEMKTRTSGDAYERAVYFTSLRTYDMLSDLNRVLTQGEIDALKVPQLKANQCSTKYCQNLGNILPFPEEFSHPLLPV